MNVLSLSLSLFLFSLLPPCYLCSIRIYPSRPGLSLLGMYQPAAALFVFHEAALSFFLFVLTLSRSFARLSSWLESHPNSCPIRQSMLCLCALSISSPFFPSSLVFVVFDTNDERLHSIGKASHGWWHTAHVYFVWVDGCFLPALRTLRGKRISFFLLPPTRSVKRLDPSSTFANRPSSPLCMETLGAFSRAQAYLLCF